MSELLSALPMAMPLVEYVIASYPAGLYQIRPPGIWPNHFQIIAVDRYLTVEEVASLDRDGWQIISHGNLEQGSDVRLSQYKDRTFYSYILENTKWQESTSE